MAVITTVKRLMGTFIRETCRLAPVLAGKRRVITYSLLRKELFYV
jgi:hypothetical protein